MAFLLLTRLKARFINPEKTDLYIYEVDKESIKHDSLY